MASIDFLTITMKWEKRDFSDTLLGALKEVALVAHMFGILWIKYSLATQSWAKKTIFQGSLHYYR